jgi:endoglucanase
MNRSAPILMLVLLASLVGPITSTTAGSAGRAFVRVNQVGYRAGDSKVALMLSDEAAAGQAFVVRDAGGSEALAGMVGEDRGAYGTFAHLYEIDFSALSAPGVYRVTVGGETSPPFTVGANAYAGLVATSLRFFEVQRCGDTNPAGHGVCHLKDGVASGGRADGEALDATGGWHDAGDYLKFLQTHGYVTVMLLAAYDRHPEAFASASALGGGMPSVIAEARIGLDWIAKLWDPSRKILYYQLGDGSDHDEWRLPEGDDDSPRRRPAFPCESGKGGNVAGKAAASFALASILWGDPSATFHDAELAARYRTLAEAIYKFGKKRQAAQPSTDGFYDEESWVDDMALAAAELHRLTGNQTYLRDARKFAKRAGPSSSLDWAQLQGLAHYELARIDPSYVAKAAAMLEAGLANARAAADRNPFGAAVDRFYWGSAEGMSGTALQALWYEDLTGDSTYREMARMQRDYELGLNPWGVSFVNSAGTAWPKAPHHQIADIKQIELVGFWNEGPVRQATFEGQGITLSDPDEYAAFQTDGAVYHDDVADYVTNEPTITANAAGVALASWYAQ